MVVGKVVSQQTDVFSETSGKEFYEVNLDVSLYQSVTIECKVIRLFD